MEQYQFEVCANSVESCLAAQAGGANRVELCAGIPEGGTTPSYGNIVIAREALTKTLLHVIIRPRGGDFLYSPIEQRIMLKDIDNARRLGADGVVFGCLTAKGDVDLSLMRQLIEVSQGMSVTFHRAFDVCRNPQEALEQIIELGCNRILTSGAQATAEQGIPLLKKLQQQADERIILLAGCGVNENNIAHRHGNRYPGVPLLSKRDHRKQNAAQERNSFDGGYCEHRRVSSPHHYRRTRKKNNKGVDRSN